MLPKAYLRSICFFPPWTCLFCLGGGLCLKKPSPLKAKIPPPSPFLYLHLSLVDKTNVFPPLPPVKYSVLYACAYLE